MEVKFTLKLEMFTEKVLIEIYRIFCDSYEIEIQDRAIRNFKRHGLSDIIDPSGIDWRPNYGAKFFGKQTGNKFRFHGYSIPPSEDPQYNEKSLKFQERLNEYISNLKQNA